jgi:hypothetical protein
VREVPAAVAGLVELLLFTHVPLAPPLSPPLSPPVLQFLASPLLLAHSFLSATVSCALYAAALSYYHYLNFLGYSALPFLERTEVRISG